MKGYCLLLVSLCLLCTKVWSQINDTTSITIPEVVITATRTEKPIESIPAPIKVITGEQIRQMGSLRLNEVLQEQTGLAIVSDHGTGIQLQGLNPDYVMILVDGEPMIGRTAGTFDLTRLSVGNIKRIEIVKGPSSSLYGSEALAGVINIITDNPKKEGIHASIKQRVNIGSNGYYINDQALDVQIRHRKLSVYGYLNRYASGGYNLSPEANTSTVPPFQNYTAQLKIGYDLSPRTQLFLTTRYFIEASEGNIQVEDSGKVFMVNQKTRQVDFTVNPSVKHRFSEKWTQYLRVYGTQYKTQSKLTKLADGSVYDDSYFNQGFYRPETQTDYKWNSTNLTTLGIGVSYETVESDRYTSKKDMHNLYGYLQHDVKLFQRLNVIAGLRMDNHSIYGSRISPKLSAALEVTKCLTFKGSVGQGFKAPDFRQVYLNFTNPVVGYSVFGSEEVKNQIAFLERANDIQQFTYDVNALKPLRAEYSTAYNLGFTLKPVKKVKIEANFFRNDISDMIETLPVAIKNNNQSVFTYFNLTKVYTKGVETDLSYSLNKSFSFSGGYQYLEAKDKQVMDDIEAGIVFAPVSNSFDSKKLRTSDYGGLFGRSKHSWNAKAAYCNTQRNVTATVRCIYRGKYGFGDKNGNLILDSPDEYVSGYFMWNTSISKEFMQKLVVQLGINNVGNFTNPTYIPSQPGRVFYASVEFRLHKSKRG